MPTRLVRTGSVGPSRLADLECLALARFLRTEMIGKVLPIEACRKAFLDLRKHRAVPLIPLPNNLTVYVFLSLRKVCALQGIFKDVEEERIVEDFEKFMIAVARRSLRVRFEAPK